MNDVVQMNILIVEDDENVRGFLKALLKEHGYAVEEAVNGKAGLEKAREHKPDLIISDGLMPVMDGFQFLQALKADPGLAAVPFIFLSAVFTGQRELDLARSLGAVTFLIKPQSPKSILDAVRSVTGRHTTASVTPAAGGDSEIAREYAHIVATKLEEKVQELRSASDEWRATFDAMTEAVALLDADGRVRRCNKAMTLLAKKPYDDIIGLACEDIYAGFGARRGDCPYGTSKQTLKRETVVFKQDGRWFEATADPIVDAAGILKGAVHILADITDRKQAEKDLLDTKLNLEAIIKASPLPIFTLDHDGKVMMWNLTAERTFGWTAKEAVGQVNPIVPEDKRGEFFTLFKKLLDGEELGMLEVRRRRKDGTLIDVKVSTSRIHNASGAVTGIMSIVEDVSEQKRAAETLHRTMRQQEALLNNIPDMAWLKDRDSRFIAVNEPFGVVCGKRPNELVGLTDLDIWPREFAKLYRADDREVMLSGKRKIVEEPLTATNGRTLWIETIKTPILNEHGEVIGTTGIARDITERKRADEILRKREAQLAESQRIAGIGSWERDLATNAVVWSKELFRILGLDPERVAPTYEVLMGLVVPEDREIQQKTVQEAIRKNKQYSSDFRIVKPDGTTALIHSQGEVVCDEAGRPVLLRGTAQDITERRQMEDALKAAVVRAEDEKARSDSIIAAIGDGITIQDRDFRILYENEAQKKLVGNHVGQLCYMAYEQKEKLCEGCGIAQVFQDGGTHVVERSAPTDKGLVHVEITASPLRDAKGNIIAGIEIVHNITERKKTENLMREQQLFTENLIMNSAVATFVLDAGHRVLTWNRACEELTGIPATEMVGTKAQWRAFYDNERPVLADIVLGREPEKLALLYSNVTASELLHEGLHAEDWFRNMNGKDRYVVFDAAPIRDSAGTVIAAIETLQDITERKTLEEQIYRAKQDWEYTFNSITDMVTVHDKDYNIIAANKAAEKILGLPLLENMKDRKCFSHYHGTERPPEGCPSCGCLQTGVSASFEIFEPHLNMFIEIRAIPRFDSNNKLIGLIHVVRDITERKKAEAAIGQYSKQLTALSTASNDLLASTNLIDIYQQICNIIYAVFDVRMVWLGIVDPSDVIVHPVAHAGQENGYLKTMTITWDDAPTGRGPTGTAIKTGKAVLSQVSDPEFNLWRSEAEKRGFVSTMAVPLLSTSGVCIGALSFYSGENAFTSDSMRLTQIFANQAAIAIENARLVVGLEAKVFERTRALEDTNLEIQTVNRELVLRREEAEAASRSKTDFLANMSHELRTPLNAIMGFSEIMLMNMAGPVSDKQREFLNDISKSGNHLLSLINDILDLSKIEAGKMELESEPVIIEDLIAGALMLFKEKTLKHAIKLNTFTDPAVADITADRRMLKQVLVNLLSNAFKFTPDGGRISVRARLSADLPPLSPSLPRGDGAGGFIEISVQDSGAGITPEHQKKLFQPFEQIDSSLSRKHAGTGLGLSLCRRFVELHDGRIWVESEPGKGSTFSFVIPVRRP